MEVAANEGFELTSEVILAAFLQAKVFDRKIYMKPLEDIWKYRQGNFQFEYNLPFLRAIQFNLIYWAKMERATDWDLSSFVKLLR